MVLFLSRFTLKFISQKKSWVVLNSCYCVEVHVQVMPLWHPLTVEHGYIQCNVKVKTGTKTSI